MLAMGGANDFREAGGNSSFGRFATGHISTSSIGRYRKVLSESQVAFMQALAGTAMAVQGCEASPLSLSRSEALRYRLLDRPMNLALMAAWRVREAYFDRTGRSPSGHTMDEGV